MFCEHKNCKVIVKEETYPVFGVDTTIIANVKVCQDCGEEIFDYWLDGDNLKRAFKKYELEKNKFRKGKHER